MLLSTLAQATSQCTLNGQPIDCNELVDKAKPFLGIGIALLIILGIFLLATFVLWVFMLIHAIQHQSKDRTIWIAALAAGFVMGFYPIIAIVYYFAEKKSAEEQTRQQNIQTPPQDQEVNQN